MGDAKALIADRLQPSTISGWAKINYQLIDKEGVGVFTQYPIFTHYHVRRSTMTYHGPGARRLILFRVAPFGPAVARAGQRACCRSAAFLWAG
jgi:hypothetical protein